MNKLVLGPNSTTQWHQLVSEAQASCSTMLGEAMESYLVFLLMRFTDKPQIASDVLAVEFLEGLEKQKAEQHLKIRDVGDKCLLFSGLFPGRTQRRSLNMNYFIELGRASYATLAQMPEQQWSGPYDDLSEHFVCVMDVLQAMRDMAGESTLSTIEIMELWQKAQGQRAFDQMGLDQNDAPNPTMH